MRFRSFALSLLLSGLVLTGCVTVGNKFSGQFASQIKIGQTTRAEVEKELGSPFRTGLDSGNPTASYLYYRLSLFAHPITQDLTVTYSLDERVKAYSFNSNDSEE